MSVSRSTPRTNGWAFKGWPLAAPLCLALLAGAEPAQAQYFPFWGLGGQSAPAPELTPEAVGAHLVRSGFKLRQIRRKGAVFLADVADQAGRPLRLVVSPANGAILERYALANPRGAATDAAAAPSQPRAKPAPSEATTAPAAERAREPAPPAAQPPVAAATPPAPLVGPGYANGVPINPLD